MHTDDPRPRSLDQQLVEEESQSAPISTFYPRLPTKPNVWRRALLVTQRAEFVSAVTLEATVGSRLTIATKLNSEADSFCGMFEGGRELVEPGRE